MTDAPVFLGVEHVLSIHHRMIREFGGSPDVRDTGLLESAVMMPAAQFSGEFLHSGVPAMAAVYLFHLCLNHPFVDGNKRTALVAAEVFLMLNDMRLTAGNRDVERLTMGVAGGRISKDETIAFFRKHTAAKK